MSDNRSNKRNETSRNDHSRNDQSRTDQSRTAQPRYDNDALGSSSRSGRGGSWSHRDDDDMQMRNSRSDRPRSAYDSELNARMQQGGAHTSAYGDEFSVSGDRYRDNDDRGDRSSSDRDLNTRGRSGSDADMGADSWGGGADRDTGRERSNQEASYGAGASYNDRGSDRANGRSGTRNDRDDYYGNRSVNDSTRSSSSSGRDDFNQGQESGRGRGGPNYNAQQPNSKQDTNSWDRIQTGRGNDKQYGANADTFARPGQHAGRGPKGYRRDDARITEDLNEALTHDRHIDASEIEVKVSGGEVTLSGTVDHRDAKRHAEDIAESISGVNEVNNQIRVSRSGAGGTSTSPTEEHRMSNKADNDKHSDPTSGKDTKPTTKDGATGGTSTADGAMSSQGSGPSGAANTSTPDKNPSVKSIPGTQGTSAHKTQGRGS